MDFLRIESTLFYGAIGLYLASMIMYFIFFVSKTEKAGNIGSFIIKIGFGLHTLALISRGLEQVEFH